MPSVKRLVVALACFLSAAQWAQAATIYRCSVNGRTVFQQSACASEPAASVAAPAAASAPTRKADKPADATAPGAQEKPARPAKPG